MVLVRIQKAEPLGQRRLRLTLTNRQVVQRNIAALLHGPAFDRIRCDDKLFNAVQVVAGGLEWPGGADLCPDAILWDGLPADGPIPAELEAGAR